MEFADLLSTDSAKVQFVTNSISLGDTFKSDITRPIYRLLFTTKGEEYLVRKADDMGLKENDQVRITIQMVEGKSDGHVVR